MNGPYSDAHRLFMQAMLSHRLIDIDSAKALYHRVTHAEQALFPAFVSRINAELGDYELALRQATQEMTGRTMLLLVNTKADVSSKVATLYSPIELAYFKHFLKTMITEPDVYLSCDDALEIGTRLEMKMKKTQALLDRLVQDYWLSESDGFYTLSLRTTIELGPYLVETYPDHAKSCYGCVELVTRGLRCEQCDTCIHHHCSALETSCCFEPLLETFGFVDDDPSSSSSSTYSP